MNRSPWTSSLRHASPHLGPRTGHITRRDFDTTDTLYALYGAASLAGTALGAYHGYRRNDSVGWGVVWALLGGAFPLVTIPVAIAQGLGQPLPPGQR